MPNGLQMTDDGLWVVDQITDRVALLEMGETSEYGVPKSRFGDCVRIVPIPAAWLMAAVRFG